MPKIYDVTVPTHPGIPVWPGGPSFSSTNTDRIADGAVCNVTDIEMCVHTGTHIDAPLHFSDGGRSVDQIGMEQLVGACVVVDLRGRREITETDLEELQLPDETRKLILKTDNSQLWENPSHPFFEDYCALTPGAARRVADSNIHLLGIDYLSVSLYKDPPEIVHRILCDADMVLIEGLNLTEIEPGGYRVTCLPFNVVGSDGAPARVILEG
ncbi:MAG: cyclase family protein [Planctomycetota bacterium]